MRFLEATQGTEWLFFGMDMMNCIKKCVLVIRDNLLINSLDLNRLWIRNLARDDRCISANGKEARFPFLNQDLIKYVATIDPQLLTNFSMPKGTGDKILLRNVAKYLGLE